MNKLFICVYVCVGVGGGRGVGCNFLLLTWLLIFAWTFQRSIELFLFVNFCLNFPKKYCYFMEDFDY